MSKQTPLLCQVAPALRGLLAESSILPLVTFEDTLSPADVTVALSDAPVVSQLKDALAKAGGPVKRVCVEGLGTFTAAAIDASTLGRAAGKVAVVTGAAQGFGLEIAQDLARQGAVVVLADINVVAASAEAKAIEAQYGQGRAVAVGMNVTAAESIAQ
ncbi:MAG: SDR family NAD(P)-dependent oxidoreductase, partial [Planctomycetes bacterium]|nr:SDR family NAD(P)-dependent oxidoreductase [Planctomycetota bacterium]